MMKYFVPTLLVTVIAAIALFLIPDPNDEAVIIEDIYPVDEDVVMDKDDVDQLRARIERTDRLIQELKGQIADDSGKIPEVSSGAGVIGSSAETGRLPEEASPEE